MENSTPIKMYIHNLLSCFKLFKRDLFIRRIWKIKMDSQKYSVTISIVRVFP